MRNEVAARRPATRYFRLRGRATTLYLCTALFCFPGCDQTPKQPAHLDTKAAKTNETDTAAPHEIDGASTALSKKKNGASVQPAEERDPNAPIAQAGSMRITMQDFDRFHHLGRFVMPLEMITKRDEDLPAPSSLIPLVQGMLSEHVTRLLSLRLELTPADTDRIVALTNQSEYARFAPLLDDASLQKWGLRYTGPLSQTDIDAIQELTARGLTVEALFEVADTFARTQLLQDHFLESISEEDIWRDYEWRHDQARVLQVHTSNTPTMDEIVGFMETNSAEIEAYFKKNRRLWARDNFEPTLDEGMRRHIAAILVARDKPVASSERRIAGAIKKMQTLRSPGNSAASEAKFKAAIDALVEEFQAEGLSASTTELFPRAEGGAIPNIGVAPTFSKEVFARPLDDPISPHPIFSNGKIWAFMLLERKSPDRAAFKRDLKALRTDFVERAKGTIVDRLISGYLKANPPQINTDALETRYPQLVRQPRQQPQ